MRGYMKLLHSIPPYFAEFDLQFSKHVDVSHDKEFLIHKSHQIVVFYVVHEPDSVSKVRPNS